MERSWRHWRSCRRAAPRRCEDQEQSSSCEIRLVIGPADYSTTHANFARTVFQPFVLRPNELSSLLVHITTPFRPNRNRAAITEAYGCGRESYESADVRGEH